MDREMENKLLNAGKENETAKGTDVESLKKKYSGTDEKIYTVITTVQVDDETEEEFTFLFRKPKPASYDRNVKTICENGEEILKAFEQSAPGDYDMILMDVQMPVMNGYDATRAIRRSTHELAKTIPVIAMTANAFSEDIQYSLAAGMNAHISKPVDMKTLEKTIRRIKIGGRGTETQAIEQ